MSHSDPHPCFHCRTFDTDLLKQVVELGVDTAVRQVCHERGIAVESINQSEWVRIILHHVSVHMMQMAADHMLLPAEIDEEIDTEIAELIDQESHKREVPECASIIPPMHGLLHLPHHANVLWRRLFEKRPE